MKLHPLLKDEARLEDEPSISPAPDAPVLIGFDGAEGGWDALELGRVIATIRGSRCIVAAPHEDAATAAREALGGPATQTREIGLLSPHMQLIECAKQAGAGTLAIGSSRRGRVGRAILGSVAKQVLHGAPCEVVVAPRGYATARGGIEKIAVAIDGTPESKLALWRAEDLARQARATIEILLASDLIASGIEAEFLPGTPSSISDVLEATVSSVDPALEPTGRRVESGRLHAAGPIAASLAEACEDDVDLLVCGSRRTIDRIRHGSMTDHLIAESPCPVLVARRRR